jgi:tetratricopeptide (TPR) repeat protein
LPKGQAVPELRESLLTQFATHLLHAKQFPEIVRVLTSPLANTAGLTASQHWLLGLAQIELKQYGEAAERMRQCLASRGQPALTPVLKEIRGVGPQHCLALCLAALKQPAASEAFQAALRGDPGNRRVRFDFARLLAETGQGVEALKWLHQLVAEDASDPLVWQLGGRVALNQPELLEFAGDWTGEAIQLHPHHEAIIEQRATALLLQGQLEAALLLWRRIAAASHPMALAAVMLCEICTGGTPRLETADLAAKVDQELLKWYRRLLQYGASSVILKVNRHVDELRRVAPMAAGRITAALAEAA